MTVLVTGATGFIASYVINYLLDENYDIIGTVRSQEKAIRLHKHFGNNPKLTLEIVRDIGGIESFDLVFQKHGNKIDVVLHIASPLHLCTGEYKKNLLIPAVNSTKSLLTSIKKYGSNKVRRVVYTSSFYAIAEIARLNEESAVFTEDDWNPLTWNDCHVNLKTAFAVSQKFAKLTA